MMSDDLTRIGLKQIRQMIPAENLLGLGDDFLIMRVRYTKDLKFMEYPFRSDLFFAIFCDSGSIKAEINLAKYTVTPNTVLICTPGNILRISEVPGNDLDSIDFVVLAVSDAFISSLSFNFSTALNERLAILSDPCLKLSGEGLEICNRYISLIKTILMSSVQEKKETIGCLVSSLMYAVVGMTESDMVERSVQQERSSSSARVNILFKKFMELVSEYHSRERKVSFYSSRLGLTPKYLSKLVKQTSGRSAPDWIDSYVILEAKNMLRYTDISIKEIVYKLNFANPSIFYKFFKGHTGVTPNEYRNG
jgi:AraC-type DNA-binding domain-containing proteins